MTEPHRIYLDNAATSFPKPESVYSAMDSYNRHLGAAMGRGTTRSAITAQTLLDRCRTKIAQLFGAANPKNILFTLNGTDSLNIAIHGLAANHGDSPKKNSQAELQPGDHVITSTLEHNSVRRPLHELERRIGIQLTTISPEPSGRIDPNKIRQAITPRTKLIAMIHASNVTGIVQPIIEIGEIAAAAKVLFLVDAAQSAGHLPFDLANMPIDFLACPGHKGLLGPLGTGILYIRPGIEHRLQSRRQGGTGSQSENKLQPEQLPEKFEAGNHNAPGISGLEAGITFLQQRTIATIRQHEIELTEQLLDGLATVPDLQIHDAQQTDSGSTTERLGVVSVSHPMYEPQILATILDENFGIETRAGLHCAPGTHRELGTFATGGTVRLSIGPFTTKDDIETTIAAFQQLAAVQ